MLLLVLHVLRYYMALHNYIVFAFSSRSSLCTRASRQKKTVMTARQLLSILRLSQSLARVRFLEGVTSEEVDEVSQSTRDTTEIIVLSEISYQSESPRGSLLAPRVEKLWPLVLHRGCARMNTKRCRLRSAGVETGRKKAVDRGSRSRRG